MEQEKEQLVINNIGLAHYIARKYFNSLVEKEDLVSLAHIGLVKAALHFEPDKGFQFASFAGKVITNEILCFMRREKKQRNLNTISIETLIFPEESITIEDVIPDKKDYFEPIETKMMIQENMKLLTTIERKVLEYRTLNPDVSQREMGRELNLSQSYISRIMKCIRAKMLEGKG